MGRKSKTNQLTQEAQPTPTSEAQYELDREFLRFLEEHAIINKFGYEYKSDIDKEIFHTKYSDALNRIRAKFGLSPIELSKSTLERVDLGEPKKKRGRKPKVVEPVMDLGGNIVTTESTEDVQRFSVDVNHKGMQCESVSYREPIFDKEVSPKQVQRIVNEIEKANKILSKIINIVSAVSQKL